MGPNSVTTSTATTISGVLAGNGTTVAAATSDQIQAVIGSSVYAAFGAGGGGNGSSTFRC